LHPPPAPKSSATSEICPYILETRNSVFFQQRIDKIMPED
jgi:hypothetical protein